MIFTDPRHALRLFLDKLEARSALGAAERQAVLRLPLTPRRVDAHREIVGLGQHVETSCLVAEGLVARFAQTEEGKRQFVSFHIPGDMVDLYSLMLPAAPSALVAISPAVIFQTPHASLRAVAFGSAGLSAALWRDCVVDGAIVAQWLVNIGRKSAHDRIAHLLCEMAVRYASIGQFAHRRFPFNVTQEQIGDALGLTSVHVNRSLKTLREEELVETSRTHVTILDWKRLAYTAEFDPAYLHLPTMVDAASSGTNSR